MNLYYLWTIKHTGKKLESSNDSPDRTVRLNTIHYLLIALQLLFSVLIVLSIAQHPPFGTL